MLNFVPILLPKHLIFLVREFSYCLYDLRALYLNILLFILSILHSLKDYFKILLPSSTRTKSLKRFSYIINYLG